MRVESSHGAGSSVRAFATIAAISFTEYPVADKVSSNNPRLRSIIRGIGVEKTGMVTMIAAAVHTAHLISTRRS